MFIDRDGLTPCVNYSVLVTTKTAGNVSRSTRASDSRSSLRLKTDLPRLGSLCNTRFDQTHLEMGLREMVRVSQQYKTRDSESSVLVWSSWVCWCCCLKLLYLILKGARMYVPSCVPSHLIDVVIFKSGPNRWTSQQGYTVHDQYLTTSVIFAFNYRDLRWQKTSTFVFTGTSQSI